MRGAGLRHSRAQPPPPQSSALAPSPQPPIVSTPFPVASATVACPPSATEPGTIPRTTIPPPTAIPRAAKPLAYNPRPPLPCASAAQPPPAAAHLCECLWAGAGRSAHPTHERLSPPLPAYVPYLLAAGAGGMGRRRFGR